MVRVSKRQLKQDTFTRISELLIARIAKIQTNSHAEAFLNEILTPSEKIMLAKRLAIIVMLNKNHSYTTIAHVLKVSPSTIGRMQSEIANEKFDFILSQLQKASKSSKGKRISNNFFVWLDIMLSARMPPMGKGRWKFLDEIEQKKNAKWIK